MRIKHRERGTVGIAVKLNPSTVSPAEVIILFEDGEMTTDYVVDWDPADPKLTNDDLMRWLVAEEGRRLG